ncbi:MAG: MFS transporter [Acidobacteria bacterium]|nr:MFS transporter [Acidobacteriota bacterium]
MHTAARALFLTVFIDLLGFGIVVPILAFSAKEYGANGMTLGLILGSFSLMQFIFAPVWGSLSDHAGRRPVIMASLVGNVLGFCAFALAANVAMLFASRILCGIAAASVATAQAYVADSTDEANRTKGMALIGMAFGLGIVLGPPIGGTLSSLGSGLALPPNMLPGAAAASLSIVAMAIAFFTLPESKSKSADGRRPGLWSMIDIESWILFFRLRQLRLAGGSLALLMCTLSSLAPILVLVGRDQFALSARDVGILFGLMGLVVAAQQLSSIHVAARHLGDVGTGIFGAASLVTGLLLIPFTRSVELLVVAVCLMGVGQGLCHPTLSAYISKVAPPSKRGGILGVSSSMNALARCFGPPLAGLAYDAMKAPGAVFSQAAVALAGVALSITLLAKKTGVRAVRASE